MTLYQPRNSLTGGTGLMSYPSSKTTRSTVVLSQTTLERLAPVSCTIFQMPPSMHMALSLTSVSPLFLCHWRISLISAKAFDNSSPRSLSSCGSNGIPISESIFWTDSTCILGYIANEDKQFHTFVANRVTAIQEATSSSQWKHIGTKQNPADGASCGLLAKALLKGECWLTGPDFLWKSERFWPSQQFTDCTVADNDPEVKKESQVFSANIEVGVTTINKLFGRFSSLYRLKKFVAWILRYRTNLQRAVQQWKSESTLPDKTTRIDPLPVEEMNKAEREILRHMPRESFKEEIAIQQATGSGVGKKRRRQNKKMSS